MNLKILVTSRCNSRCKMCNIWKSDKTDIDIDRLMKSIDVPIRSVSISGGEPTLYEDIVNLVEFLPCKNILLNTNGLLPKKVLSIVDNTSKNLTVGVSVDGIGNTHDHQRGIVCFDRVVGLIKEIKNKGINTVISYTITPNNMTDLFNVYQLSKNLKCGFATRPVHSNKYYSQSTSFSSDDIYLLRQEMKKLNTIWKEGYISTYFTFHIPDYLECKIQTPQCHEFERSLWIDEIGNVFPCPEFKNLIMGNIYKQKLSEIMLSDKYKEIKKELFNCRKCWNDCAVIGNLEQSYHGILKYPIKIKNTMRNLIWKK